MKELSLAKLQGSRPYISLLFFKDFLHHLASLYKKRGNLKRKLIFHAFLNIKIVRKSYKTYYTRMFFIVSILYLEYGELLIICTKMSK